MQGFSAFRALTTIDFRDHDLIAFTGPTGAGKSTIIDGIVFALYGSVTRYDNEKLVAPIINAVSTEARVRLDFAVGGVEYTAVRVVRRTASGASTKEARLEQGNVVLASTAQELSAEVERLLGLNFTQFTKTVVLPQGDFARFLTEKASARQRLLRRLLGLEVFAEVGKAARQRSKQISSQGHGLHRALKDGQRVSEDDINNLTARLDDLAGSLAEVEAAQSIRSAGSAERDRAQILLDDLDAQLDALSQLTVPGEAKSFAVSLTEATSTVATLDKRHAATEGRLSSAIETRSDLPSTAESDQLIEMHEEVTALEVDVSAATDVLDASESSLTKAMAAAEHARGALERAEESAERTRIQAGALGIAATLQPGDQCPVCDQPVGHLPQHSAHDSPGDEDPELAEAERSTAGERTIRAVADLQRATTAQADANARAEAATRAVVARWEKLDGRPTLAQAHVGRKRAVAADAKVEIAQSAVDEAALALLKATNELDLIERSGVGLRRQFTAARDAVVALGPPKPSEESLRDDWAEMVAWGQSQTTDVRAAQRAKTKEIAGADKRVAAAECRMLNASTSFFAPGVEPVPDLASAMLQDAHADARIVLANAEDRRARQLSLEAQLAELDTDRAVADELGKHLASGMFERWIMADVMMDLADRASIRLSELSAGAYSLTTNGTEFEIRDHRNADEVRSVRTLSGGETFLTSLSLALALRDSITDLASTATPPLESMFLDEGFGTLDSETLDIVAAAIEDLGASGRMIGLVTHIRELADRVPTRFDVQRGTNGSTVTEVA
ncbi:MAG: exonuclease SbcC [Verrucomicrobiales bacterium]|jgi:exonuclease SbcC